MLLTAESSMRPPIERPIMLWCLQLTIGLLHVCCSKFLPLYVLCYTHYTIQYSTIIHAIYNYSRILNYRLFCSKGLLDNIMIIQLTYWSICVFKGTVLLSNFVNFLWL